MARFGRSFPIHPVIQRLAVAGTVALSVTASDSAPATDSVGGSLSLVPRTCADSAAGTDSITGRTLTLVGRTAADSAPATDSVIGLAGRVISDSAPATDSVARTAQTFTRASSDSITLSDAVGRTMAAQARPVSDSAPATDSAARATQTFTRAASDSIPLSDVVGRTEPARVRSASDTAPATDSLTRTAQAFTRAVVDTLSALSDAVTRATQAFTRTAADTAPATDVARTNSPRFVSDSAPATDALTRAAQAFTRAATDSIPLSDVVGRTKPAMVRTASDSAPATDAVTRTGPSRIRSAADSITGLHDAVTRTTLALVRTATDHAAATDSVSAIVVGTGGAAQNANPNWPLVGIEVDFSTAVGPPTSPPTITRRSMDSGRLIARKFTTQRGRQYELDQVQAGQASIEVPDLDELLNPDNPASPYNSGDNKIDPYRPMWIWGMWPNQPGSGNLYNQNVTLSADAAFESSTGPIDAPWGGVGSGTTFAISTAQAWTGSQSVQVVQGGSGFAYGVYSQRCNVTNPGITYTASAYVYPTGGASVTIGVYDSTGTVHTGNTASVQNTWTRIFVSWTAVDTLEWVNLSATGTGSPTFFIDAMQLEFGAHLDPFTLAGPQQYPIFTGYCERFPSHYDMDGMRAIRPMEAVDALALLSRTSINQSYEQEIQKDQPQFVLPFDDPSGPPIIEGNPQGFQTATNVQGGSVSYAGDSLPDGTPALSLSQQLQQSTPVTTTTLSDDTFYADTQIGVAASVNVGDYITIGTGSDLEWATVTAVVGDGTTTTPPYTLTVTTSPFGIVGLQLPHSSGDDVVSYASQDTYVTTPHHSSYSVLFGGAGATFEGWFKPVVGDVTMMLAGENLSGAIPTGFNVVNPVSYRDTFIGIQSFPFGMFFVLNDPKNGPTVATVPATPAPSVGYANFPDGIWHYYAVRIYANPANANQYLWSAYVDNNPGQPATVIGTQAKRRARFNEMTQIASTMSGPPQSTLSASQVAYYPYALGEDRLLAHYLRGKGYEGETTGARVTRLLTQYWGGLVVAASSGTLAMANDFTYDPTIRTTTTTTGAGQNRTLLDVLQEIQETERGLLYVDRFGQVIWEDRESRYVSQTSIATFGEDPTNTGAELPYSGYESDFDPTYTFTQANLTSVINQNFLPLVNPVAQAKYGQRVITQQVQAKYDFDLEQAGIFYLTRYGSPKTRITKLTLKPSANPALWPVVLSLDISQRYRVIRRSPSGVTVTAEYYIESVNTSVDPESGDWTVDLQLSPVFVPSAWILGDATYGVLGTNTTPIY